MSKKLLVVVDMQNDFIDGALGTKEAREMTPRLADHIRKWDGNVALTQDTHGENYKETMEGKKLPVPHCVKGTEGWKIHREVVAALEQVARSGKNLIFKVEKPTFGSLDLAKLIRDAMGEPESIEVCGLCTGICVLSNVAILKATFPDVPIMVRVEFTECVSPETKRTALEAMKLLQVDVMESEDL